MVYLGRNILWGLFQAAAVSALLTGIAYAQTVMQKPDVVLPTDFPRAPSMDDEYEREKQAREDAYRAALKKIPDKGGTKLVDPWGGIRSTAPASPTAKQGQQ
jgi:hypothetical protein